MKTHYSYEDLAAANAAPPRPDILEAFSGVDIVRWAAVIKFKLAKMIDEQVANHNNEYADLIRTFLNIWQSNAITGSINRETLEVLKAACSPMAVMKWNPASYFQGLETSLNELIADQEQLPTGVPTDQNQDFMGGAGSSMPPMGGDFGPEENPPGTPEEPKPGEEPGAAGAPKPEDQIPIK